MTRSGKTDDYFTAGVVGENCGRSGCARFIPRSCDTAPLPCDQSCDHDRYQGVDQKACGKILMHALNSSTYQHRKRKAAPYYTVGARVGAADVDIRCDAKHRRHGKQGDDESENFARHRLALRRFLHRVVRRDLEQQRVGIAAPDIHQLMYMLARLRAL